MTPLKHLIELQQMWIYANASVPINEIASQSTKVFIHIRIFYVNFKPFPVRIIIFFSFQMVKMCIKKLDGDTAIAVKCLFYLELVFPCRTFM